VRSNQQGFYARRKLRNKSEFLIAPSALSCRAAVSFNTDSYCCSEAVQQ